MKRLPLLAATIAALSLAGATARAELIVNGDFGAGQAPWTVTNGASADFSHGDARVSARNGKSRGVAYNLLGALNPSMAGQHFTTRCSITVASPTPARVFLRTTEGGVSRVAVLAEEVILEGGVPHQLRGTHTFNWTAFPTAAIVEVVVGHDTFDTRTLPLMGVFPDYTLDDFSIDDDADGDGLTDLEEGLIGTSASSKDHDGDSLPDLWEYENNTDPLVDSEEVDQEMDGWTNRMEYWAATDPWDPESKPGVPSNPNATPQARAVLEYLATLPANGPTHRAVVGQHLTDPPSGTFGYNNFIATLAAPPVSREPGVIAFQFDDGANPPDVSEPRSYLMSHWNSGGLVEIKYNPRHPWTQGFYSNPDPTLIDIPALLNPDPMSPAEMAAHDFFMADVDAVAAELQSLRDQDVVVLWRFCSEMTGAHFWWGYRGRDEYIQLWRFFHDYFTDPAGWNLANLLWVYESETAAHFNVPIDYYYPGDEYVDLMGHNFYHDTFRLEFDANALMSRYPKVYACPQVGPEKDPAYRDGTFSNMNYLVGTDGLSGFINNHPRLSYFAVWDSFFNVYYNHIAIADNPEAATFMQHDYLVTRDELPSALWLPGAAVQDWAAYE
jgi:hypothetical protein